jgi:hypothetical protein
VFLAPFPEPLAHLAVRLHGGDNRRGTQEEILKAGKQLQQVRAQLAVPQPLPEEQLDHQRQVLADHSEQQTGPVAEVVEDARLGHARALRHGPGGQPSGARFGKHRLRRFEQRLTHAGGRAAHPPDATLRHRTSSGSPVAAGKLLWINVEALHELARRD